MLLKELKLKEELFFTLEEYRKVKNFTQNIGAISNNIIFGILTLVKSGKDFEIYANINDYTYKYNRDCEFWTSTADMHSMSIDELQENLDIFSSHHRRLQLSLTDMNDLKKQFSKNKLLNKIADATPRIKEFGRFLEILLDEDIIPYTNGGFNSHEIIYSINKLKKTRIEEIFTEAGLFWFQGYNKSDFNKQIFSIIDTNYNAINNLNTYDNE